MARVSPWPGHLPRACWFCARPIQACMGFVLARDYLAAEQAWKQGLETPRVRELCGFCVEKAALLLFGDHVR